MDNDKHFRNLGIVIIGGGLSGLSAALLLNKNGLDVTVIEKKRYPFHRVCGEYVSNEVLPFLKSLNLDISELNPSRLNRLAISSVSGKILSAPLDLGGFGISRYSFDDYLYQRALEAGVNFIFDKATNIHFEDSQFEIGLANDLTINCSILVSAYGKRSNLDQKLKRPFFYNRSPYMGVKYHIRTDFPKDLIQLDHFEGGYCGICKIEKNLYNLCYLTETKNLKKHGTIAAMEEQVLFKNPHIKYHFKNSEFLFKKPEVINEITFERKSLVEDHILFCGDAAGMIAPLCGNGMAMAIHSGKILAESIIEHVKHNKQFNRGSLEKDYQYQWKKQFALRLQSGRIIQNLFSNKQVSNLAITTLKAMPALTRFVLKKTHGSSF
ncbi:MAG: NAD(P)/FAD-dependent oxidoreductase [Daejeonella sp.]